MLESVIYSLALLFCRLTQNKRQNQIVTSPFVAVISNPLVMWCIGGAIMVLVSSMFVYWVVRRNGSSVPQRGQQNTNHWANQHHGGIAMQDIVNPLNRVV